VRLLLSCAAAFGDCAFDVKEEGAMFQSVVLSVRPKREVAGERHPASAAAPGAEGLEDQRLVERVAHALSATGYGPLRDVAITAQDRLVVLAGRVPSYYLKQVAQATALSVPGAHQVRNDLDVIPLTRAGELTRRG
jgi:osmotically-inducible protein OsmY